MKLERLRSSDSENINKLSNDLLLILI